MRGEKVVVNGKLYPHLARADKLAKLGQKARNAIINKYGLMSPEGMANREALPAEVIRSEAARSGDTGIRQGDGYTPLKLSQKDLPRFPRPAGQSGGVIGVPKNFVEKSMPATGEGVRTGFIPDNTTAGIARATKQAFTYKSKMDARDRAYSGGSDVSRHANDILIRDPKVAAKALKTSTKQALKQELSTMDTVGSEQGLYDNFLSYMHDVTHPQKAGTAGISAPKGTRWVSKDTVGDLGKSVGPRSKLAQAADTLNSGVTAATVYAKPSHVPQRFVTDATTSALSGALTSVKTRAFVKALRNGGLDERQLMESQQATGTHGYLALPHEGSNLAAHAATKGANFFANHVDARFRFMNLAHEARKAGIDTVPEFKKMLNYAKDPSKRIKIADAQKYEQVLRRSDRVSMMYDGLTPTERATVSRALWFYPWMKAATRYGGHVMAEHPLAAGVGANVGAYGRKVQRKELGALPSFEYGLIPFNHGHTTSSAGWLWPFNTTGQVAELGARPQQIIGNLNPATQAGLTAISGLNSFGDTVPGGRGYPSLKEAASEMFAPTPEASILKDYLDQKSAERKTHMFPHKPSTDFLTRLLVGPSYPKVTNKKALHKAAQRESGKGYSIFIPHK
jgi:hypothetical protein